MPVKQALSGPDIVARKEMAHWFLSMFERDGHWVDRVWFSDESHFCLHSAVNRKSNVYWSDDKPCFVSERPLHSPKVTVWCALSSEGVIGPYFFENEAGDTVTVTQETYRTVLGNISPLPPLQ